MYSPDSNSGFLPGSVPDPGQSEDLEASHALFLQHAQAKDPRVYHLLLDHYGIEIFCFIQAFLDLEPSPAHNDLILDLVGDTFNFAAANVAHFYGSASVSGWLVKIAIERVHHFQHRHILDKLLWKRSNGNLHKGESPEKGVSDLLASPTDQQPVEEVEFEHRLWDLYGLLPEKQRLLILLRYLQKIKTTEIGQILNLSPDRVVRYLVAFRDDLSDGRLEEDAEHPFMRQKILRAWEGNLDDDQAAGIEIRQHLAECPNCHDYLLNLERLDATTSKIFQARWPPVSFEDTWRKELASRFNGQVASPNPVSQAASVMRYSIWIVLAVTLFVGIAWIINLTLPMQDQPIKGGTPPPIPLPTPVTIDAKIGSTVEGENPDISLGNYNYNLDPRLSGDGRWVVYVTEQLADNPPPGAALPGIYLFDRQTGETESIKLPDGSQISNHQGEAPSISADGRWIVYSAYNSDANGLELDGQLLLKPGPGILLYDRETGQTELIDRTPDGTPAQGASTDPVISADGDWIAYWSDAQDIVDGQNEPCAVTPCLDLYLYNRSYHQVKRIPIGRNSGTVRWQMSLSADGRYLALTLLADDQVARKLALHYMFDAFIYDRVTGNFNPINIGNDGSQGNDASFDPHLSADGYFVAFSSSASNLVSGDTNNKQDVFVRDLQKGLVERVSVGSSGEQGNADSGTLNFGYLIGWSEGVSISADGRYVTFSSFAGSLADDYLLPCSSSDVPICNLIYVHDRQTGRTDRFAGRIYQRSYIYPDISADGKYITYLEVRNCDLPNEEHACSEVWVYDQDTKWTTAVTRLASSGNSPEWISSLQILTRGSGVPPIAFSPDGQVIATGNNDGSVHLLSVENGALLSTLRGEPESEINSIAFSPDGTMLAAGAFPGVVKIWRLTDNHLRYTLNGHPDVISNLSFSSDGSLLVVGGEGAIWIWRLEGETFRRIANLSYPEHFVSDIALSPNNQWLAVAGGDETVWIQKIPSGEVMLRLGGQTGQISTIAFSPDGNLLAVGSSDHSVNLWDSSDLNRPVGSGDKPPGITYVHTFWQPDGLRKISFSPDGNQLLTLADDKWLRSWNLAKRSFQATLFGDVYTFSSSPTGGTLAVGEGNLMIRLWRGVTGVANPQFFLRAPSEAIGIPIDTPPSPESGESKILEFRFPSNQHPLDLYQAGDAADFPLQVPAYLPPGVAFYSAFRTLEGAVMISYDYLTPPPDSKPYATILLCERTVNIDASACGGWIGKNAVVENVKIGDQPGNLGEYVTGDWYTDLDASQNATGKAILRWSSDESTRWLRWQNGDVISTLYATALAYNVPFSKDDLAAIAASQTFLFEMDASNPITIHYLVREGDTCQGIASQYGTTVRDLVDLNDLASCEMIVVGQTILVPLPQVRKVIGEYDLDCNGQVERLQVIGYSRSASLGLVLETRGWNGLYKTAWYYTFNDAGSGSFMRPELIHVGGCEQFVAVDFVGSDSANDSIKIFRWDGKTMNQVLEAKGSAGPGIIPQGLLSVISTHQRSIDPSNGACQMITVDYGWDGRAFVELGRRSGEACTP